MRIVKKILKKCYRLFKKAVVFGLRVIGKIDEKCFRSYMLRFVDKLIMKRVDKIPGENYAFLKHWAPNRTIVGGKTNYSKVVEIPTCDLILAQYDRWHSNYYYRYDIAVRVLALEQMDGKNDFGQDWDDQMQENWTEENWHERFEKLYKSVKENGFNISSCVESDKDLRLEDGSHRTAIAYHIGQEFLKVRVNGFSIPQYYYGWDKINLKKIFSKNQMQVIEKKMEQILQDMHYPFTAIIWTPAINYFDDIIDSLNTYNPNNVQVEEWRDITMTKKELSDFISAVYFYDDVLESNVEYKKECNFDSSQVSDDKYRIRILRLNMKQPYYMTKSLSGVPQSRESVLCKENIRSEYSRYIHNYKRDVILHIADNYLQSKFIWQLVSINRDITDLFDIMNKSKVPYVAIKPKEEPEAKNYKIELQADFDILTSQQYVAEFVQIIKNYCQEHFRQDWIQFKEIQDGDHVYCVVYLKDFPLFTFDIQTNVGGGALSSLFVEDCLSARIKKNLFYVLPEKYEVPVRIAEYCAHKDNPNKKKHKDYALAHKEWLTERWLCKAFGNDKRKIENMLKLLQQ